MPIRLKHLCSKIADGTHFSPPTTDEGYPYITAKDVHGKGIDFSSTARISEDNYLQLVKADCKPEKGDVLIVKDGATTGRVGMVIDDTCFVILSSVAMLRPIESCMSAFLMYVLESELIQKQKAFGPFHASVIKTGVELGVRHSGTAPAGRYISVKKRTVSIVYRTKKSHGLFEFSYGYYPVFHGTILLFKTGFVL